MDILRTPDECFAHLADYPFEPHYTIIETNEGTELRIHHLDEGPKDGPIVLLMHGQPVWSYLYRKMIPVFAEAGLRAIAVDHIGFGRSDKLTRPAHYTFESHIEWMRELVVTLDLRDVTIVCQDWGGPIAMGVLGREPDRFSRVVAGNTMLHTAEPGLRDRLEWAVHESSDDSSTVSKMLLDWMHFTHRAVDFAPSLPVSASTARGVTPEVAAAYDAPFPTEWHLAAVRQFPLLIPVTTTDPGAGINRATGKALADWPGAFLTLFGDSDPPTRGWAEIFQERVPGAKGQPHRTLERAGHFWQEDCGEEAARIIVDWITSTAS